MCNMTFYQKQNRLTLAIPQKQRWDLKNKIKQEFLGLVKSYIILWGFVTIGCMICQTLQKAFQI